MKQLLLLLLGVCILFSLSSCIAVEDNKSAEDQHTEVREFRESYSALDFDDGYDLGYEEGFEEAKYNIANQFPPILADIEASIQQELQVWSPEEAATIVSAFLSGEDIPEEDLLSAISSLTEYYYRTQDLPQAIESIE